MNDIWVPSWLYKSWPAVCGALAGGYVLLDYWGVGALLGVYAIGILFCREG